MVMYEAMRRAECAMTASGQVERGRREGQLKKLTAAAMCPQLGPLRCRRSSHGAGLCRRDRDHLASADDSRVGRVHYRSGDPHLPSLRRRLGSTGAPASQASRPPPPEGPHPYGASRSGCGRQS